MTMRPIKERQGLTGAEVVCDECGAVVSIRCDHMGSRGRPGEAPPRLEEGHAIRKLNSTGWKASARKQVCPDCVAAPKNHKPKEKNEMVQNSSTHQSVKPDADIPQPTRDQKREIMLMLQEVYDADAKRYTGAETDQTVAAALGIARWGWVSTVREEFFGPAGNEAADLLAAEVKAEIHAVERVMQTAGEHVRAAGKALIELNAARDQLVDLLARVKGAK